MIKKQGDTVWFFSILPLSLTRFFTFFSRQAIEVIISARKFDSTGTQASHFVSLIYGDNLLNEHICPKIDDRLDVIELQTFNKTWRRKKNE